MDQNKSNQQNSNRNIQEEEVDLGSLFKVIGKGIKIFFLFIADVFKSTFHYFILLLIFFKKHAIKLGLALLVGFIIGFILQKLESKSYESNMIIETNYNSGMHLYKQIEYLNDLIKKKDSNSLSNILAINLNEVSKLSRIEILPYQPKKNLYIAYDNYMQETDTAYTKGFKFEDFKKRINDFDLRFHKIEVNAKSKSIFKKLTPAIIKLVENDYYNQLKKLKIDELSQKIKVYNKNLNQIDSLRETYKQVALKEAENKSTTSTIEIAKTDSKKVENDIKLFETSNNLLYGISQVNKDFIRKNDIVNIISDFNKIGVPDKKLKHKKYFQLAILFFGLILGWILLGQLDKYLNSYISKNK